MNRRRFLGRLSGASVLGLHGGSPRPAGRPSFLLVLAGGWRGQTWPLAADSQLKAPNLKRLTRLGAWFRRAYTANPANSPARAALLTGRFPHLSGVLAAGDRLPDSAITVPELLAAAGYETSLAGAWSTGASEPEQATDSAIRFLGVVRDAPFFLGLCWDAPAGAGDPPAKFAARYAKQDFRLRPNVPASLAGQVRPAWRRYYAWCSALDAQLGRLLDALDDAAARDTVVIFTSDRGWMLSSHGLDGDEVAYEEAVRVPLLIRGPGLSAATPRTDLPVSLVDLAPVILNLAGLTPPPDLQGRDFLDGGEFESVYCQGQLGTPGEWRMVVRGLDKVIVDRDLRITHLFNLGRDPYEMDNLVAAKQERRKRDEMLAIMRNWMKRAHDRILPSGLRLRD